MGFSFKAILGTVAPFLTAALPGPFGGMANAAIAKALGLKPDAAPDDVQTAIAKGQLTGDQIVELKKAEEAFQLQMQQLGFENTEKLDQIAADDRDSARKREIAVKDWTPRLLAGAVTVGFFGILSFMLVKPVPDSAHDALMLLLGTLAAAWGSVVTYYFGSSAGSAQKTQLLAQAPALSKDS